MSPKRVSWWLGKHFFDRIKIIKINMLDLEPFRQTPNFCGPASLKMVFFYYGVNVSEKEIAKIAGTTKEKGTSIEGMIKAADHFGFDVFVKEKCTLNDLRHHLDEEAPVIIDWFLQDDGHYSIVVGIDRKNVMLRDPSFWTVRKIPIEKFLRVWFDFSGEYIEKPNDLILRLILVLTPKK